MTFHTVECEGFVASKFEGNVTNFPPHEALKFRDYVFGFRVSGLGFQGIPAVIQRRLPSLLGYDLLGLVFKALNSISCFKSTFHERAVANRVELEDYS